MTVATAKFWDRTAIKYSRSPVPDEAVYQKKLEMTQSYLNSESVVLEIACGTGTTALHHAPKVAHIDALDISEKMLEIAREKQAKANISNVSFRRSNSEDDTLPNDHYDMVMAHSILHLIGNKERLIARIYKSLKPGGIFVTSTPCLGNSMRWLKPIAAMMSFFGRWPAVQFFSSKELETALITAGFKVEESWLPQKAVAHFLILRK